MIKKSLLAIAVFAVMFVGLLQAGATKALAATVNISQTGNVVTASNGTLTITYDLSTGKGNFSSGSTSIISNFYSDYGVTGSSTRISSFDAGTRSASWATIGTDGYGINGKKLTITNTLTSGSSIILYITLYENKPFALASMTVTKSTSQSINFLEPIAANNLDIGTGTDKRIYTTPYNNNYDYGVAPVNDFGNGENQIDRTNTSTTTWGAFDGTSYWVAAMFDNTSKQGFIAGAANTPNWKSMQYLHQASTANGPLTGFSVYNAGGAQSGTSISSDKFFLGYYSNYQDGLEQFGQTYAVGEPKLSWTDGVPMGYNSYYSFYGLPTVDAMHGMIDYFAANLKPLGYTYMNLDCCYKGTSGQAYPTDFQAYSDYVHNKGLKAGNYTAPFFIYQKLTDTVPGAPTFTFQDIALKDSTGSPIQTYLGAGTYIIDATHPGAQAYLKNLMDVDFVNVGMDYAKLDFLDLGMYEGNHYDASKNGMQAYRIGMQIMRDELLSATQHIYINESIAPLLPSGYAHGRRSGIDTTIPLQGDLYSGIERQAFNSAASWWTNGTLYTYNDPDMALPENIANGFYKNTLNQSKLYATVTMLEGGHNIIGDNVPFISEDRMKALTNPSLIALSGQGKAAKPIKMTNFYHKLEHSPSAIYSTDTNGDKIVGLSNWNMNSSASTTVTFADLGLSASTTYTITELYSNTKIGTFTGSYTRLQQPGESVILRISPTSSALPLAPANLAAGKTATASSFYSAGYEASKVTDGDISTRWSAADSQYNNQWVQIDFGAATSVNRIAVKEYGYGNQNFQINTYNLQYWNGTSFVNLKNGFTIGDNRVFDFPTVSTSKIRIYVGKANFLASINEIEAYNITGNTGSMIDQDNSTATYSSYSDIRANLQRMQTFSLTSSSLPRIDMYLYESYVSKVPEDNLYIDIVKLDVNNNPVQKLFTAALPSNNIPGAATPYAIYPKLTGLDTTQKYGIILRSPASLDDGSTNNKYGFAYNDSNTYTGGVERVSTNGGTTWSTENSGNRDLIFTIYK
ncbi:coagulation factor 5/8 type domain-containing protein [Paenibacillus pectinilyticus]|uniref:Coagulation factor 5/8 type domain-containing protein n=1 Tax=Paenibacillus pectinilyticus TaxID=512399 RepID=A0A1C0ZRF5_9BACL|nr:discoidin domain-containing protein [Paenibacillus pectinilyticus]OCT10640.1 coagulation factor 5/8 type domain-containing protein [Paenibacillus pectinilyticus]